MKRVIALMMICCTVVWCAAVPAMAAGATDDEAVIGSVGEDVSVVSLYAENTAKVENEDGLNIPVVTTWIILSCAAVGCAIIGTTIFLAKKNKNN